MFASKDNNKKKHPDEFLKKKKVNQINLSADARLSRKLF